MPRIISLIASATEIVCALEFQKSLVGRSHECDFPEGVEKLPVCTEAKIKTEASSLEIDRQVKTILEQALSVYKVDADALKKLKPDILVTQTQCEVCAVSLKDVQNALCDWFDNYPQIISLAPNTLSDVFNDIERVAQALEAPKKGTDLVSRLNSRIAAIAKKTREIKEKPTIACIEWIDPLMAAGNWMPELVKLAGGTNLFGQAGKHSPWMTWEMLEAKNPDILLIMPCGFDIARSRKEMPALTRQKGWKELKSVRAGQVYMADGNQYFNRPGPRLVESLEILAEILHPNLFSFNHKNKGWTPYP